MDVTLLLIAGLALIASIFLFVRAVTGFRGWKLSEKVGAAYVLLPFAAAAFGLNALFGGALERPSKIVAASFTLVAGLFSVVKQVAATIEAHPTVEGVQPEEVSMNSVLSKLVRG